LTALKAESQSITEELQSIRAQSTKRDEMILDHLSSLQRLISIYFGQTCKIGDLQTTLTDLHSSLQHTHTKSSQTHQVVSSLAQNLQSQGSQLIQLLGDMNDKQITEMERLTQLSNSNHQEQLKEFEQHNAKLLLSFYHQVNPLVATKSTENQDATQTQRSSQPLATTSAHNPNTNTTSSTQQTQPISAHRSTLPPIPASDWNFMNQSNNTPLPLPKTKTTKQQNSDPVPVSSHQGISMMELSGFGFNGRSSTNHEGTKSHTSPVSYSHQSSQKLQHPIQSRTTTAPFTNNTAPNPSEHHSQPKSVRSHQMNTPHVKVPQASGTSGPSDPRVNHPSCSFENLDPNHSPHHSSFSQPPQSSSLFPNPFQFNSSSSQTNFKQHQHSFAAMQNSMSARHSQSPFG